MTSFCWSNDNKWIVTASDDKTANLWSLSVPDPVMTFSFMKDNFGTDKEGGLKPSKVNSGGFIKAFIEVLIYFSLYPAGTQTFFMCLFNFHKRLQTLKPCIKVFNECLVDVCKSVKYVWFWLVGANQVVILIKWLKVMS